jgi:hypothetical protein
MILMYSQKLFASHCIPHSILPPKLPTLDGTVLLPHQDANHQWQIKAHLVHWKLERVECICPAVNRSLIILALHGAVTRPVWAKRPRAEILGLASIGARSNSGVESGGLYAVLDPVDHGSHVDLRVRTRLKGVGGAVSGSWNEEETVPVIKGFDTLIVAHTGVHDGADGVVVVN